jgi:nicotinamide mononucleotide transporter
MFINTCLDLSGSILDFLATIFFIKLNYFAWPISVLACIIDIILYFREGIYADAGLSVLYIILMGYGWYKWTNKLDDNCELLVSNLSFQLFIKLLLIASLATLSLDFYLRSYTDSQIPFWDAVTTVLSLIAQWLTCKKIIQNWHFWLVIDSMYCGIYIYKGIPAHALLQVVYLGMAFAGCFFWQKQLQKEIGF